MCAEGAASTWKLSPKVPKRSDDVSAPRLGVWTDRSSCSAASCMGFCPKLWLLQASMSPELSWCCNKRVQLVTVPAYVLAYWQPAPARCLSQAMSLSARSAQVRAS